MSYEFTYVMVYIFFLQILWYGIIPLFLVVHIVPDVIKKTILFGVNHCENDFQFQRVTPLHVFIGRFSLFRIKLIRSDVALFEIIF